MWRAGWGKVVPSVYHIIAKGNVLKNRHRSGDGQRSCLLVEKQVFLRYTCQKRLVGAFSTKLFFFLIDLRTRSRAVYLYTNGSAADLFSLQKTDYLKSIAVIYFRKISWNARTFLLFKAKGNQIITTHQSSDLVIPLQVRVFVVTVPEGTVPQLLVFGCFSPHLGQKFMHVLYIGLHVLLTGICLTAHAWWIGLRFPVIQQAIRSFEWTVGYL